MKKSIFEDLGNLAKDECFAIKEKDGTFVSFALDYDFLSSELDRMNENIGFEKYFLTIVKFEELDKAY